MAQSLSLLTSPNYVEVPFIKVTIGDYTFGAYDNISSSGVDIHGAYKLNHIKYPNYVKSIEITKINGQVNKYTLRLEYTITENDDPNFFEKVFSSVSLTRKIVFSYGDLSLPTFIYREEEGIILDVKSDFAISSSKITYTVEAVSTSQLLTAGAYTFRETTRQPSGVIEDLLYNPAYGLLDIFTGMRDKNQVDRLNLIPHTDVERTLELQTNMNVLDYLRYLVSCMTPNTSISGDKKSIYVLTIHDTARENVTSDTEVDLKGTYFKITKVDLDVENSDAYEIDIGYPSKNVVIDFHIDQNESYSIYYDYQTKLNDAQYVQRINNRGEIEEVYAPIISSGNAQYKTEEQDKTWWAKVTDYPIKCSIKFKGLVRPAILMNYVRLNVYFFGRKHISSGLYIVTKQVDTIDETGFRTTLNLMRVPKSS